MTLADVLDHNATKNLLFTERQLKDTFLNRIETFVCNMFSLLQMHRVHPDSNFSHMSSLPRKMQWILTFQNVGNHQLELAKFYLEPAADDMTVSLFLWGSDHNVAVDGELALILELKNIDYSKVSYRRTLVFESQSHI